MGWTSRRKSTLVEVWADAPAARIRRMMPAGDSLSISAFGEHASVALGLAAQTEQSNARPQRVRGAGNSWNFAALLQRHDQVERLQSAAGDHQRVGFGRGLEDRGAEV